ncbi:TPA: oxidoreductase [Candidatus Poribacteria bacterium]|nr:oxidoreductase [Candidatus Poribacteria bacterium]MBT22029.1 oxidoreductase [Candidatus Poribacteria bacterium]MEE2616967.1 Gfo/Idh/MocA family oxidoreductase [Candidatus Poribacteria bacterium]HCK14798.1 oxidoreductase [Candidatus Poribacteria bacterium]|tara:strand:- start:584 stop:1780 length:1197 start_codon:yes stop_codon:yes gene_type:complete
MAQPHKITMLGTGFIADFYTLTLHNQRGPEQVHMVYSRSEERAKGFQDKWGVPNGSTSLKKAINSSETDTVIIGLPNNRHEEAVIAAAEAGKAVLCTKPLGRNAEEAKRMLDAVEKAGVFNGYLEDLVYPPKTLKAIQSVKNGALGKILWVRSRETHPGPHSDWFWDIEQAGGGAIVDMGCHCVEIIRNFVGKGIRPVEAMCWADTLVHPIDAEDHGIGLIRFENGAMGQFEVSWAFRGGMDLRDEISGSEGTIWLNHWLRTGYEMFTSVGQGGYVAEKAEGDTGWLFPVGDEAAELGYTDMFNEMFNCLDNNTTPMETFYDGYVVNAMIDACYKSAKSKQWEPIQLEVWRGEESVEHIRSITEVDGKVLLKTEVMPDGKTKQILKDPETGRIIEQIL